MNKPFPLIEAPEQNEFATYYGTYVHKVPEGNVLETLRNLKESTEVLLQSISEGDASFRYAPEKWTIKQLVGHLIDVERVMTHRAFRFYNNDKTELPGFEENHYIEQSSYDERSMESLIKELKWLRKISLMMFSYFKPEHTKRAGMANGYLVSVRALIYIIAGHEIHHLGVLQERYLSALSSVDK